MGSFDKIIKGAMDAGQDAVDMVKSNPKTASAIGGAAGGVGLVEYDKNNIIEQMRELGYSAEEILDYLQNGELKRILSEKEGI